MGNIRLVAAGLLLGLAGSGCIVHVDDRPDTDNRSWEEREKHNRNVIDGLELGSVAADVRSRLGGADFSEGFSSGGHEYRVLFYRTHRVESDGETTRNETTPVVFRDDELIGWGDTAYRDLADR